VEDIGAPGSPRGAALLPEEEADAVLVDQMFRGSEHGAASALKVEKGRAKVKGKRGLPPRVARMA